MPIITRAISIRQPYVELILRGIKTKEYRSQPTRIRERVYLYASNTPGDDWKKVGKEPGDLPTGVILGSVEIVDCRFRKKRGCYGYVLKNPKRFRKALHAKNQAQPKFWIPKLRR